MRAYFRYMNCDTQFKKILTDLDGDDCAQLSEDKTTGRKGMIFK